MINGNLTWSKLRLCKNINCEFFFLKKKVISVFLAVFYISMYKKNHYSTIDPFLLVMLLHPDIPQNTDFLQTTASLIQEN